MSAASDSGHCSRCGHGLLPRWLHPSGECPGCGAAPALTDDQRRHAALVEVGELIGQIKADLCLLALAVDCIDHEVQDALTPTAVLMDGLGGDAR